MMAAILNSAILNSAILNSAILLKTLTQTNSIWLKLIHSDSTWWWQPFEIYQLGFSHFAQNKLHSFILTQLDDGSHLEFCHVEFRHMASWIQTPCYLLSDSLKNALTPPWLWIKLIPSDSNSFILTQLDDGSHLEFCQLEFHILDSTILVFPLKLTHTCQDWFPPFAQKTSLIYSDSTCWWLPSWIWPSWNQPSLFFLSNSLTLAKIGSHHLHKNLHSFILTQLDDGSHLEFCHVEFRHMASWIQTPCYLLSDSLKNTLTHYDSESN